MLNKKCKEFEFDENANKRTKDGFNILFNGNETELQEQGYTFKHSPPFNPHMHMGDNLLMIG